MAVATVGKWASQVQFSLLVVHTAECFPTRVRAVAVGSSMAVSRLGAIAAPFLNRMDSRWRSALCAGLAAGGFVVSFMLPDTLHTPLTDTLAETRDCPVGHSVAAATAGTTPTTSTTVTTTAATTAPVIVSGRL